MGLQTGIQTNFSVGEIDPLMRMRNDTKLFFAAAERLRNVRLLVQGGARRRPGTRFLLDLAGEDVQMMPFIYSDDQLYLLILSPGKLRAFDMDGQLLATVTVDVPWTADHIGAINWTQQGDTTFLTHPVMGMWKILRTGASSFAVSRFAFEEHSSGAPRYQPYWKYAASAITLTPSATTGAITLTASAAVFVAGHVGTIMRIDKKEVLITAVASATSASATVRQTLGGTTATASWDEQTFSDVRGWPRAIAFHADRLWLGGPPNRPNGIFASKTSAYFNFDVGTAADTEAIDYSVGGTRMNEVLHLKSGRNLQVFSGDGEQYVPQSTTAPITPKAFQVREQTPYGCARTVPPLDFDGASVFVQKTGKAVREFVWGDAEQAYGSDAVSLIASHLIRAPTSATTMMGAPTMPEQYALFTNGDGTMPVYHAARKENLRGWVLWETQGLFKTVASVDHHIFVAAERTIDGEAKRYLEKFDESMKVDCGVEITGAEAVVWPAACPHLVGKTVEVVSGSYHVGDALVLTGGDIATDDAVTSFQVGLGFDPLIRIMPVDGQSPEGVITTRNRRIVSASLVMDSTMSAAVAGQGIILRQVTDDLSLPPDPITGIYQFRFLGWSKEPRLDITVPAPLDFTLLGLTLEVYF
jgi:hypothetical protein